jgi:hypothetical protein
MEKIFKAKRLDNGEWHQFTLSSLLLACYCDSNFRVIDDYKIDEDTISQYIGIKAQGKRMFEGDEVSLYDEEFIVKFSEGEFVGDNSDFKHGILSTQELKRSLLTGHNIHDRG